MFFKQISLNIFKKKTYICKQLIWSLYNIMFELNIEDIMAGLEELTIQEKVEKLDSLSSDLEDALQEALGDVDYAKQTLIDDYEKSVNEPLFASVSQLINQKYGEDSVTINKTRMGRDCFIINSKPISVRISTQWNQWDQWDQ